MTMTKAIAFLLSLATAAGVRGQDTTQGVLTRPPAVIEQAVPEYPKAAKAQGLSGEVVLELDISAEGGVIDARVAKSGGNGFDEAALDAARRLRFSPAEIDGRPSIVSMDYRFRFDAPPVPAPVVAVLRGIVVERGTRKLLAGVSISAGNHSAFTGSDGRFEIPHMPPGKVGVVALDPAHQRFESEETLEEGKALEVKYYLLPSTSDSYEAVIVGQREKKEVTTVTLTSGEVTRIAGVSGDMLKVVQNLPGVARAPGGFGLLVVRGGNPNDTRLYVDGVDVPLVFHFGGLTSVVPSDLADAVDFEAGNFGVRHGRATGGRLDLRTRDPEAKRLHLVADVNLYQALATGEGPVGENVSIALAARRSYADALVSAAASKSDQFGVSTAPRYYDLHGKLVWRPTPDDAVRLYVLGSDDRMVLTGVKTGGLQDLDRLRMGIAFAEAIASWDHRFSDATRGRLAIAQGVVDVSARFGTFGSERDRALVTNLRAEGTHHLTGSLSLAAGVDSRIVPATSIQMEYPETLPPNQVPGPDSRMVRMDVNARAVEAGVWTEATWKPLDGLVIVPGIRAERTVFVTNAASRMAWLDPRLSARWSFGEDTTLKGGLGLYHQMPLPTYLTKEWGNPDLHQEGAWHSMVGVERRIWGPLTFDLQVYYKGLFDLVLPTDATVERGGALVPRRYTNGGSGSSYGAELLLRWSAGGRFFGWLAYSLSRSVRDQRVVGGTVQPGGDAFDQPHNLVALGTMDLPEIWTGFSAGFRVRSSTGNPYLRTVAAVYDADADLYQPVQDPSKRRRTPAFFQLDLRADKRWTYRTWILSAYLEVQNVTNRKNPEDAAYSYDYSKQGWMTGLPLFPSFGIRAEY